MRPLVAIIFVPFLSGGTVALFTHTAAVYPPRQLDRASRRDETCTSRALALQDLIVLNARVQMGSAVRNQNTSVTFQIENPATGLQANCSAIGQALTANGEGGDPFKWYDCSLGKNSINMTASFQYNAVISDLTLRETWRCSDKLAERYVFFFASSDLIGPAIAVDYADKYH